MIIRGGENIYPREIEEFLRKNQKVRDVHVVGIPDKKYGEQVLAAVILKPGTTASHDEFISFCQGKIARHKIPRYWEFVDSVPMTASGKVQKFKMVEQYARKYGS
jgi:fatty-acyl-CoA synthase